MTAQEAFKVAFDEFEDEQETEVADEAASARNALVNVLEAEAFVMDKSPQQKAREAKAKAGKGKKFGTSGSMAVRNAAAAPGAANSSISGGQKSEQTMAEHMAQYHKDGFDPKVNKCKLFDSIKEGYLKQGMSPELAEAKALIQHNGGMTAGVQNAAKAGKSNQPPQMQPQQPQQPQGNANQSPTGEQIDPRQQEQHIQQMEQNPASIINNASTPLVNGEEEVPTPDGSIPVTTDTQKAAAEVISAMQGAGGEKAKAAAEAEQKILQGIVPTGQSQGQQGEQQAPQAEAAGMQTVQGENPQELANQGEQVTPAEPQPKVYRSKEHPGVEVELSDEEVAILAQHPEREDLLEQIIHAEAWKEEAKTDEERQDIENTIDTLNRRFYGSDSGSPTEENDGEKAEEPEMQPISENPSEEDIEYAKASMERAEQVLADFERDNDIKSPSNPSGSKTYNDLDSKTQEEYKYFLDVAAQRKKYHEDISSKSEAGSPRTAEEAPSPEGDSGDGGQEGAQTGEGAKEEGEDNRMEGNAGENVDTPPPETPDKEPPKKPVLKDRPSSRAPITGTPPPRDAEFATKKKNVYKVGDQQYVDVSRMGFFHSLAASFMAGLRGQDIITGLDRVTGKWNAIKRSEAGSRVRDGITSSLCKAEMDKCEAMGLTDDARLELAAIRDEYNSAKTAAQRTAAAKKFIKWKSDNKISAKKQIEGDGFKNLAQKNPNWKAPPRSIFPEVSKDERDTSFMDTKREQIVQRLERAGVPVEIVESINGSSVVQYKVKRLLDGTDKALRDALKALQSDIGVEIAYTADTKSGEERMGLITINNPKVKDASMQRLLEDEEGIKTAQKMMAPLLMGETADGRAMWVDVSDHGFLGGDSGSGKSERIIGALSGAYSVKSPSELQVVINAHVNDADYEGFEDDPHTGGIGHNEDEVAQNLVNANAEWKRRQKLFAELGFRDLKSYNKAMEKAGTPEKELPQIIVITDEVTDLLARRPELADEIDKIVRNGRKFGVAHVGVTQDMGADNMPSKIKGATRMGVQANSATASKKIFDVHAPELAQLNRKGDILVKDSSGKLVRLRGAYADEATRARLREYNTGKMRVASQGDLTPEYKSGVEEAIKNKQPISVANSAGMEEQLKKDLPKDWTIEHEQFEGQDYIKASPPKPTRVDVKEAAKKDKDFKDEDFDMNSRQGIVEYARKTKEKKIEKAKEKFKKHKDPDRMRAEMDEIEAEESKWTELADRLYPEAQDGDDLDGEKEEARTEIASGAPESTTTAKETIAEEEKPDPKVEARIESRRKQIEERKKDLIKGQRKNNMSDLEVARQAEALDKGLEEYEAAVRSGQSDVEFFEVKEKAKAEKDRAEKEELKRKQKLGIVHDGNSSSRLRAGAIHILDSTRGNKENIKPLAQRVLKRVQAELPDGFEIDTDDNGRPLGVNGQYGYARREDGSWGMFTADGKFKMIVDTSSPHILGEDHHETKAAKKHLEEVTNKHKRGEATVEEVISAQKDYNLKARGVEDEWKFSENVELVAWAVAQALNKQASNVEG